jgi:hypothetical protein
MEGGGGALVEKFPLPYHFISLTSNTAQNL